MTMTAPRPVSRIRELCACVCPDIPTTLVLVPSPQNSLARRARHASLTTGVSALAAECRRWRRRQLPAPPFAFGRMMRGNIRPMGTSRIHVNGATPGAMNATGIDSRNTTGVGSSWASS